VVCPYFTAIIPAFEIPATGQCRRGILYCTRHRTTRRGSPAIAAERTSFTAAPVFASAANRA